MKTLSIIIPVYNEEKTLQQLSQKVFDVDLAPLGYKKQIIFVNDWSEDASEEIIQDIIKEKKDKIDIKYIKNKKNSGKWFSLKEWFKNADGDLMIVQDADLEYFPEDYKEMIRIYEKEKVDFVYGSRILGMKKFENTYFSKSFLVWWLALSRFTTLLVFKRVSDEATCYKMYDKKLKKYLILPEENWFEREPAITMLLFRKWFTYKEIPIHYKARNFDEGKKINWKDGVKALWTLIKWRFKKI